MALQGCGDLSASRMANLVAPVIVEALEGYRVRFEAITRRADQRFATRDWKGAVADARERLDLYGVVVGDLEDQIRAMLEARVADRLLWAGTKAVYSGLIEGRQDWELAETFFNSATRRIFSTLGVDSDIEFVDSDFEAPALSEPGHLLRTYPGPQTASQLFRRILADRWFKAAFADPARDAALAAARLERLLGADRGMPRIEEAEIVAAPFFRRKGAYLVGRVAWGETWSPMALALLNTEQGVVVDALLTDEDAISILFSFTRSHFHVDLGPAHVLVRYLKRLLPKKPIAELYIALGHHKHGKTELYRDLLHHLRQADDRFDVAPGTPGTVMVVFAMPGYDVVLKVIRDRFPDIKPMTPAAVRNNYRLVFHHDRAGRLVEAQEFEHLEFDSSRFSPRLLTEFGRGADHTVLVGPDRVVLHHAYVERRVTPLDVHLRRLPPAEAEKTVIDFGQAIKDLAANGIFPGELLPKNFGVTRHGRVVSYDYDELSLLTDFTFRELPTARADEDEYSEEAWFGVGPRDVFPAEFSHFIGLPTPLLRTLGAHHGDLYEVGFWTKMQDRVKSGELVDIFPYPASDRLHET